MKPGRVIVLVIGSLLAVVGFGMAAAGATLGWALATQRDDAGYFTTNIERFESTGYAVTSEDIDLGEPGPEGSWEGVDLATVRIEAERADAGAVFVGIGSEEAVEAYLDGVVHDEITEVNFLDADVEYRRENAEGSSRPDAPGEQDFWVAQASGTSTQVVTWDVEPGQWAIVLMNEDGGRPVTVDVELGAKSELLGLIAIGLGIGAVACIAIGAALIVLGVAKPHARDAEQPSTVPSPERTAGPNPLRLEGRLDGELSRWLWLVKWLLAIPHFIVLALLWVAFAVTTIVAWFSILFTGRYPRSIFDLNVGVLRWTWRVAYYATSAIATDRYPPFTLEAVEYPATLDVAYPAQLSRGLVLIKSWLLAIPHLIIVGVLAASWSIDDDGNLLGTGGLLGILVAIAALSLLFTGRYPIGLFDLIMGVNRWVYRVVVYCALMTDEYPPFRLDQGGVEAGAHDEVRAAPSIPPPPPGFPA